MRNSRYKRQNGFEAFSEAIYKKGIKLDFMKLFL